MLNIVLFGPPGAGKGTQAAKLIGKYRLIHLSTGDILRGEIVAGTALGLEAKKLMDKGILVPDEVVIGMINSKLEQNKNANGFIFDGFPRTVAQAEALDNLLRSRSTAISLTLALEVDNEELTKRILHRGKESGRADDQDENIVRNRIGEYNNKTAPLKEFYSAQGKCHLVNGIGSIDEIFNSLCKVIDEDRLAEERFKREYVPPSVKRKNEVSPTTRKPKGLKKRKTNVKKQKKVVRRSPVKKKGKKTAHRKRSSAKRRK